MNDKKGIPWWVIITSLVFASPLGMILLFIKLFGADGAWKENNKSHTYKKGGYRAQRDFVDVPYRSSDKNVGAEVHNNTHAKRPMASISAGKGIRLGGLITLIAGSLVSMIVFLAMMTEYYYFWESALASIITFLCIGAPGLALAFWGNSMLGKAQRYRRYSQVIGDATEVSVDRLSGIMGISVSTVFKELEKMLDNGYFNGYYIDYERRVFTNGRMGTHIREEKREEPVKETAAQAAPTINPADQIRMINGAIIHPEVSQKIMTLENLTRRIYSYTETYPEKEKFARSFKDNYLPKTIKILEAYSRFEQSGSSGENVRIAMKNVEAVLDVLISSFEKQLDMLYMDEALDVTTDIDVLEAMMATSGLGESPFSQIN